jgi:hypothetical protein
MTQIKYNQVRQKGSHNSYQRTEGYPDQALYWRIRSLEIDIHNSNNNQSWPQLYANWYVYHTSSDDESSVNTLEDALDVLVSFHQAVPKHEVITIWLDLKDNFVAATNQTPESLDQLLVAKLGRNCIWGPPDLIGSDSSLQQSIKNNGWPTLDALVGKFIFACTTGDLSSPDSHLNQYIDNGATANQRLAFVAPDLNHSSDIYNYNYVVLFNLSSSEIGLGQEVQNAGFVSRAYGLDSKSNWCKAWNHSVHHLTTNKVNAYKDEWARTDLAATGYPFTGLNLLLPNNLTEAGRLYAINVNSGNIGNEEDSFFFQFDTNTNLTSNEISSFVGNPVSHVDSDIKAGIMARSTNNSNSAFVAVLRTGDEGLLFQYRSTDGAEASSIQVRIANGVNGEPIVSKNTPIWLQLSLFNSARTVNASYSIDGIKWNSIAQVSIDTSLYLQGWAASSNSSGSVKWLFGGSKAPAYGQAIGKNSSGEFISSSAQAASLGPINPQDQC